MNKKSKYPKISLFILLSFFSITVKSQEGTINYKLTVNDKKLNYKTEQNLIVYFYNSSSIELIKSPKTALIDQDVDDLNQIRVLKTTRPYFIFKDLAKNTLLLSDYLGSKKRVITDTLNNFKWKLTNQKQRFGNYLCRKATLSFRGRAYEAWYTEEIPLRTGPWKFGGLPGLIIKIKDSDSSFIYELTGINLKEKVNNKLITIPQIFANDQVITYKEYRALYKEILANNLKLSRVEQVTPDGTSGSINITLPEKQEKF